MIPLRFCGGSDEALCCGDGSRAVDTVAECLDDWIDEDNPVRVIDAFVEALDLAALGFEGVDPAATGRPSYHPSVLLKLYIYGYLNRVQSSRRLEREAGRRKEKPRRERERGGANPRRTPLARRGPSRPAGAAPASRRR